MSMKHIAYGTLVGVFAFGVTLATAGQRVPPAPPPPPVPPMAPAAAFVFAPVPPVPPAAPPSLIEPIALGPPGIWGDQAADELYRHAQDLIDAGRYERAIEQLDKLIVKMSSSDRVDAALYWKAYSLEKLGQVAAALTTIVDMEKRFADSRWIREAKALEIEIRQASGQTVSPEAQNDEELKLLALRGLMQSDPDRALPAIEMMLSSNSSIKVKERALFVLSQSRSARAREIITGVAKAGTNPDLQLRAIRYLGAIGAAENRQILDDVYRASTDVAVKRAILRSFMTAGDRARLLSLAKTEALPELRGEAVRQLGVMHAGPELGELYRTEQTADVKKKILQAMFVGDQAEKLVELAETKPRSSSSWRRAKGTRSYAVRSFTTWASPGERIRAPRSPPSTPRMQTPMCAER